MPILTIDVLHPKAKINRNLYGHFSEHLGRCIYGGVYVGENSPIPNVNGMRTDVVEALKKLHLPVLRWPGGCFADEYHWRDGIGPKEKRRRMVNTNWGGVVEDNSFGTHEFMELCRQVGCEPYVTANVGSGTVQEMAEWVEYLNSDSDSTIAQERWKNGHKEPFNVKYWGVGNENWGCGGEMYPEYYADVYRRYRIYCRDYGENRLYRVACGPAGEGGNWTEILMKKAANQFDALSLHYYTVPETEPGKNSATNFSHDVYASTIERAAEIDAIICKHLAVMNQYDPHHRVGLIVDEWGTWYNVEPGTNPAFLYQQNTMRDAMVAALTLNIFNHHADRVVMANIAQLVNVLQSVILTDGTDMLLTPTYHVFDMFQPHMDAQLLDSFVTGANFVPNARQISASASIKDGTVTVTCANLSDTDASELLVVTDGMDPKDITATILTGDVHDKNTFEKKDAVCPRAFTDFHMTERGLVMNLPACALVMMQFHG